MRAFMLLRDLLKPPMRASICSGGSGPVLEQPEGTLLRLCCTSFWMPYFACAYVCICLQSSPKPSPEPSRESSRSPSPQLTRPAPGEIKMALAAALDSAATAEASGDKVGRIETMHMIAAYTMTKHRLGLSS